MARVQHQLTIIAQQAHQLNTQLEQRVMERTQQLELTNSHRSKMAFYDSLTQLPNRALLMKQLWEALEQKANPDYQVAIFYLDCDIFAPSMHQTA